MPKLPDNATDEFVKLAGWVRDALPCEWPYPKIKGPALAIFANESGWGHSVLAEDHHNYAGMKWNPVMEDWPGASAVDYKAWDGTGQYTEFTDYKSFAGGFLHRLEKHPAYAGWQDAANQSGMKWLEHVAPVWFGGNERDNYIYLKKIRLLWESRFLPFLAVSPYSFK